MSSADHEILAERMNAEPAIFRGCSSSELGLSVLLSTVFWLPVSVLLGWLVGAVSMALGIAAVAIVATVVLVAACFQHVKRGRPDGYYQQRFTILLSQARLRASPFIRRNGHWSIGRSSGF